MLAAGHRCLLQGVAGVAGVAGVGGPVVQVGPGVGGAVAQLAPLLVGGPVAQLVRHLESIFGGLVVVWCSLWRTVRSNTFWRHAGYAQKIILQLPCTRIELNLQSVSNRIE